MQPSFFARHANALKRIGLLTISLVSAGIGVALALTGVFAPLGVGFLGFAGMGIITALSGTVLGYGVFKATRSIITPPKIMNTLQPHQESPLSEEPGSSYGNILDRTGYGENEASTGQQATPVHGHATVVGDRKSLTTNKPVASHRSQDDSLDNSSETTKQPK